MATEYERIFLRKFVNGAYVTNKEKEIIEKFALIGFVQCGYDWDEEKPTAKLTELCRGCLGI